MRVLVFDRFEFRPVERQLLRDGQPLALGARAMDVLGCLVERRGSTVTKDELLAAAWPGLVVEESNLSVQVSALRKALGPGIIATVSGIGYRLSTVVAETGSLNTSGEPPAIAVLPLRPLGDPGMALLAEGLTADVIALLARVPGFLLISRYSTATLQAGREDLGRLARELGVRYFVEGTLRVHDGEVSVAVQLVDASLRILWSGTLSTSRERAEDLQEGIARAVISQLQPELTRAEIELVRRQRRENLDAWACYHQAVGAIAAAGWTETAVDKARMHLRRAIEIDPGFGLVRGYYAVLTALGWRTGLVFNTPGLFDEVVAMAEQAVDLDGRSPDVLSYAGCALSDIGRNDVALPWLREALEIDPSNPQARVAYGALLAQMGRHEEGFAQMRLGMRTSPRDRRLGFWNWVLAALLLRLDRAEEALEEARIAWTRDARLFLAPLAEAGALARLGRPADAAAALARARTIRPSLRLDEVERSHGPRVREELADYWSGDAITSLPSQS